MKQLDLVVPGLCGPLPELEGLRPGPVTQALANMLSRARRSRCNSSGLHPELASLFGMEESRAMPSAALSLLGHGRHPGQARWLHADPVHLQADMDHAILRDSQSLDITPQQAESLVAELNAHLEQDDVHVVALDANNWFMSIGERDVSTSPLHDVIGCNVNFFLPRGDDEKYFKSLMNEVQMLLHMSPVNREREQNGLLPVNSLWLWGEGELPAMQAPAYQHVYSESALIKGLAENGGIQHHSLDDTDALIAALGESGRTLVFMDALFNIACYGDVPAWQERLEIFFSQQLEPIVSAAMRRKMRVNLYPCNGTLYCMKPGFRLHLFRRHNIEDHIAIHES